MATRGVLLSAALTLFAPFALLAGATDEESGSSTEMAVPVGKYKEAPMLAALVAAGESRRESCRRSTNGCRWNRAWCRRWRRSAPTAAP